MKKSIEIIGISIIASLVVVFALFLAGLGTTGLTDVNGNWISLTTVKLGVNEFALLIILVVFVSVIVSGFAFNAMTKKVA